MIVLRGLLPGNSNLLKHWTVCADFTNFKENLFNLWNFTFLYFYTFTVADSRLAFFENFWSVSQIIVFVCSEMVNFVETILIVSFLQKYYLGGQTQLLAKNVNFKFIGYICIIVDFSCASTGNRFFCRLMAWNWIWIAFNFQNSRDWQVCNNAVGLPLRGQWHISGSAVQAAFGLISKSLRVHLY